MQEQKSIKSIPEIFLHDDFSWVTTAVVQKLSADEHNLEAMAHNFTEHWPKLSEKPEILVRTEKFVPKMRNISHVIAKSMDFSC